MKLICLNTWGGKSFEDLMTFISRNKDTDIFCFQEIYDSPISRITPSGFRSNLLTEISSILNDFSYQYSPQFHGREFHFEVDFPLSQGIVTFWKKEHEVKNKGEFFVFAKRNEIIPIPNSNDIIPPRNITYVEFENFICLNLHGYWAPSPKFDTPQRLDQSQKILDFVKKINKPVVIAGDFNLDINTRSVAMFEDDGFINLVKESNAITTRSSLYDIKWRTNDKFADYIFTKDLKVKKFEVMTEEVSDHLPLFLEFDL